MANVNFLRGTQANLEKLTSFTEGAFYLTSDSDRLYFAQSSTELVHLNHNVIHVANVASLPALNTAAVGDFYYAIAENVLCTKSTANSTSWVQINKNTDTNDDTKVIGVDDVSVVSDDAGITISFDIKQTTTDINKDEVALPDIPVSFTIKRQDIATANNISVGVATSAVTGGVKVATTGDGSSGAGFNVTGGNNVTVARDASGNVSITAKDTTYDISATNNQIVLTDSNGDEQPITLQSGNNAISVNAAADVITVTHKDYGSKNAATSTSTATATHGGTFTVVDNIVTDKGHVTGYNLKTVTLPKDNDTKSSISAEAGNIVRLTETNGDSTEVQFLAGNADIELNTNTDDDTISIKHKEYAAPTAGTAAAVSPSHGTSFTVLDSITTNNGHVTGYKTKQVTLPVDNDTTNTSANITADNTGKLTVTVADSRGDEVSKTSGQVLYYVVNGKNVYNQGSIDFYTKDEIDTMVESVNAMTYKGTIGTGGTVSTLPTSGVKIGDTYKVVTAGTHGGHSCDVGDLLIAIGTETDGVITSGLTWTYVPSGDDVDSQYELVVANNTATLKNTVTKDEVGAVTIAAGNDVTVNTSGNTITVAHEAFTAKKGTDTTAAPAAGATVTVLDSITTDNGHVTGYTNKVITLPADKDTKSSISVENGNVIRLTETDGDSSEVKLASGNEYITLTSDTTADKITATHKTYGALSATPGAELTPAHGGNFTVVTGVTRDAGGHLSGFTTQKVTLPADNDTQSSIAVAPNNIIRLTETNGNSSDVQLLKGTQIALESDVAANTITIKHDTINTTKKTDTTAAPSAGTSFTVLDSLNFSNGHVTGYTNKVVTLPADNDTTYSLNNAVTAANNIATHKSVLTASNGNETESVVNITSSNLKVTASNKTITMNLEWGSF